MSFGFPGLDRPRQHSQPRASSGAVCAAAVGPAMGLTAVLRAIINAPTVAASAGRPAGVAAVGTVGTKEEEAEQKRLLKVESREKLLREREEARQQADAAAAWATQLYALTDAVDDEVSWGYEESHGMMFDEPLERYGWWVRYNPLYWALIVLIMGCLIPGRWVHLPFGQGGPVRDDEMEVEKKIRLEWIYCTDGPFAMTILLAIVEFGWYLSRGEIGLNVKTEAVLLMTVIAAVYIGGNVVFVNSMKQRSVVGVRAGICANGAFAIGMATLLVLWIVQRGYDPASWSATKWGTIALRTIVILFFLSVIYDYAPLWDAYGPLSDAESAGFGWSDGLSVFANAGASLLVVVALFLASAFPESASLIWQTLVG